MPLIAGTPAAAILGDVSLRARLLLVLVVFALLAGTALGAERGGRSAAADGTLAVRDGRGTFTLQLRGAVIGRIDRGKIVIQDADEQGAEPIVRGAEWWTRRSVTTTIYGGKGIRFRVIGGRFTVRVQGATGLSLSAVGRGHALLKGAGLEFGVTNGEYSVNGEDFLPIPDDPVSIQLRAPAKRA